MRIFYHNDFDGLTAAGVFSQFVDTTFRTRGCVEFESINYDDIKQFYLRHLLEDSAIIDFAFHPDAKWWFDHHPTAFGCPEWRKLYRASEYQYWNTRAKSCPSLLLSFFKKWYPEYWDYIHPEVREIVKYANIIDSAMYSSPSQIFDFTNNYMTFNYSLQMGVDPSIKEFYIGSVRSSVLNKFFDSEEFNKIRSACIGDFSNYVTNCNRYLTANGKTVLLDFRKVDLRPQRYIGYLFEPDCDYTVILSKRGALFHISLGYNPWKKLNPIHIGSLMREFGGGGRKNVGAVFLRDKATCDSVVMRIMKILRSGMSTMRQ